MFQTIQNIIKRIDQLEIQPLAKHKKTKNAKDENIEPKNKEKIPEMINDEAKILAQDKKQKETNSNKKKPKT